MFKEEAAFYILHLERPVAEIIFFDKLGIEVFLIMKCPARQLHELGGVVQVVEIIPILLDFAEVRKTPGAGSEGFSDPYYPGRLALFIEVTQGLPDSIQVVFVHQGLEECHTMLIPGEQQKAFL